ncbi:MAG TPA: depupylase/deamidase Dop [Jiangellaceae bacterium]|nr:depupylase/deamidase Dop [Jiangellaceae bacterium]
MTTPRIPGPVILGLETEYGITAPAQSDLPATALSAHVVNAYADEQVEGHGPERKGGREARPGWDYQEENPLRDARGFDLSRTDAEPGLLTDDDTTTANLVLTNGARFYVDHAHPEYSTPEVTSARDAVLWDVAGERVVARAAELAERRGVGRIGLYKNNVDGKGASYGSHENYLTSRSTAFARLVEHLVPFFVTRQVFTGAGRVGLGPEGHTPGFQISQRADYVEVEVGLETTLKRPIINTRDEPHADPDQYRRLHVIIGDANCSETSTYLKMGTTSLVLAMIEAGAAGEPLSLETPVADVQQVSHDPSLQHRLRLADGRSLTALEIQELYLERATEFVKRTYGDDIDEQTSDILARWGEVLDQLGRDPFGLADQLDWVAKLQLLESYRTRDALKWSHPKLALIDLQYSDVRPEHGLYHRLVRGGRMRRLLEESEVIRAVTEPPADTRAYFRGRCLSRYAADVVAASWDSVIFDVPGEPALQRVPTLDPVRGTRSHVGKLLESSDTAGELLERLSQR